jgi:hypothetical protein
MRLDRNICEWGMVINRRRFLSSSVAGLALAKGIGAQRHADLGHDDEVSSSARGWTIPRPMFWGFENNDPREQMAGYSFSFQVFTVGQNGTTYSIDAKSERRKAIAGPSMRRSFHGRDSRCTRPGRSMPKPF